MERAIDPVTLTLVDGEERGFLLSMGGLKRLKTRFKAKDLKELLAQDIEAVGVPILFEALLNKGELTEDQFADMLPSHLPLIGKALGTLLGASFPENPPVPIPATIHTLPLAA